jgi:photosystem II stability/assembly factor-like uncharacterized protein
MTNSRSVFRLTTILAISLFATATLLVGQRRTDDTEEATRSAGPLGALRFRTIGVVGNRAAAIVGEPGNPNVIYIGAASGGIFKTDDGTTYRPVFDDQDVAAIGALAVAPSAHNVVWAGTGEAFVIRPYMSIGDGVYKSTDAGRTWHHMGLEQTGRIARVLVHPHNPDVVYVCAAGQMHKPQHERGVFKTTDGGKSWQQVLFVDENTGCSDLAMDPDDPDTLFAGAWQIEIHSWILNSGGPSSGIFVTHDGGEHWSRLAGHGLPAAGKSIGKIGLGIAPSNPNRVYALIEEDTPRFYRSDNRGATWRLVNQSHLLDERAPYYTRFAVAPDDENLIFFVAVAFSVSRDGGETLVDPLPASAGGDNHDVWFDPTDPNRVMVAHDGGASISNNKGVSYKRVALPIAQMYGVSVDNQVPYNVYGDRQDGESFMGPSNSLRGGRGGFGGGITPGDWRQVGGCESGFATPDPVDNNIVWNGCFDGQISRINVASGQSRMVSPWPVGTYGWTPSQVKYRWNWAAPIEISPHDHNRVYVGSQFVHETTDGGQTWHVISPDLTTNDRTHQQDSGGVALDNPPGTYDGSILYVIKESPVQSGVIWTGSNDGQVNVTRDGGKTWANVTKNMTDLPPWGWIWGIEPSHFDAGTAYVAINLQQQGDYKAYVYKTADFGKSWKLISADIPKSMNSSARSIIEDPVRKGMLFLGTDNALYFSLSDGASWTRLRNNLPPVPMYQMVVQPRYSDLVIGTYGRGFWILDDITPLRELDKAEGSDLYLFKPRDAYRYRTLATHRVADVGGQNSGQNPPYGADINFYLKSAGPVEIAITGPAGEPVRKLKETGRPGINRVWWDLRYDMAPPVRLRTSPPGEPWVKPGPEGFRSLASYGPFRGNVTVAPGVYTVKLTASGKTMSAPVTVLRDPKSVGSDQQIKQQVAFMLELRSELNDMAEMINRLEEIRTVSQLQQVLWRDDPKQAAVLKQVSDLEKDATAVEGEMVDVHLSGRPEDSFRHPMQLMEQIGYLGSILDFNWGGGGSDLPPTDSEIAVHKQLQQEIAKCKHRYSEFVNSSGPALKLAGYSAATGTAAGQ